MARHGLRFNRQLPGSVILGVMESDPGDRLISQSQR
jgi:hypothetical protein